MAPHRLTSSDPAAAVMGLVTVTAWSVSAYIASIRLYHLPLFGAVALFQVTDILLGSRRARRAHAFDRKRLYRSIGERLGRWKWVLAGVLVDVLFGVLAGLTLNLFDAVGLSRPPSVGALLIGTQYGVVTACAAAFLGAAEMSSAIDNARPGERRYILPGLRRTPQIMDRVTRPAMDVMGMEDESAE